MDAKTSEGVQRIIIGPLMTGNPAAYGVVTQDQGQVNPVISPFPEQAFERSDEGDDALFFTVPRLVVHIDDDAIARVGKIFREVLPSRPRLLDLMSSWRTHLPKDLSHGRTTGLGMNAEEMADNPDLDDYLIHDINKDPRLPFEDETFDGVVLTVSVQYLIQPVEVFREVRRVLKEGAPLVVTFSNRMFPTKAVRVWQSCNDQQRMALVKLFLQRAGGYRDIVAQDRSPGPGTDPVFLVMGRRKQQE